MKIPAAALAVAFAPCFAHAFSFDDVHFWVGEGTNRAAVVVDWSADGAAPLAWGWRWNGEKSAADMLAAVVGEDPRLHALGDTPNLALLYALGYDRADAASSFLFDYNRGNVVSQASDANALVAGGWYNGYWGQWVCPTGTVLDTSFFETEGWPNGGGLSATPLTNASWHVLQFQRPEWGWDAHPLSGEPVAAESPYAWRLVAADVKPYRGWDGIDSDPTVALGAPARTVSGYGDIPRHPATPGEGAWETDRIVKLVTATDEDVGGSITVEFDHDVVDDPRNPFGLDFIVFGNAMQTIGGGVYWNGTEDPATVVVATDAIVAERGLVEVSTDNAKWFAYTNGPYADDFAPTLSYRYNPGDPDPSLFEGNLWWGSPADATRPVDPAVSGAEFKGRSLAEYARLYDGSAGGTGFDISGFDLPRDAQGRKFIRFVRITTCEPGDDTEVDAVSDVAPTPSFRNWVDKHVAFDNRPGFSPTNLCANGAPAFVNAAFGLAPDAPAPGPWAVEGFDPATRTLSTPFSPDASDLVSLRSSTTLSNAAWSVSLPLWTGTNALGRPLLRAQTPEAAAEFFRLELHE